MIVVNELAPHAHDARWKELFEETWGAAAELTEVRVRSFEGAFAAAREAAARNADLLIAVGGDGTVNACVNGLGEAQTRLAVIPAGTANDLACLVGESGDPRRDAEALESWQPRDIDAITTNGVRFYSTGGIGWVADVAETANRWRAGSWLRRTVLARLGSIIYTLACVAVIALSRRLGSRVTIEYTDAASGADRELDFDGYGVLVSNTAKVGRSFHLAPVSRMDDGVFELILFPRTSRRRLLRVVAMAQQGRLFELDEVRFVQVTRARMKTDSDVDFFGDGETLQRGDHFELGVAPTPIRLMAPAATEPARSPVATALAAAHAA